MTLYPSKEENDNYSIISQIAKEINSKIKFFDECKRSLCDDDRPIDPHQEEEEVIFKSPILYRTENQELVVKANIRFA